VCGDIRIFALVSYSSLTILNMLLVCLKIFRCVSFSIDVIDSIHWYRYYRAKTELLCLLNGLFSSLAGVVCPALRCFAVNIVGQYRNSAQAEIRPVFSNPANIRLRLRFWQDFRIQPTFGIFSLLLRFYVKRLVIGKQGSCLC